MHPGPHPGLLGTGDNLAGKRVQETNRSLCLMQQGGLADVVKHVHSTFYLSERPRLHTKIALEKHGCLDMEDLQFEAEFLTWDQASQNSFTFACHLTSTLGIRVKWDPFNLDWIASAANAVLVQVTINTHTQSTYN